MISSNDTFGSPPASVNDPLTKAFLSSHLPARHKVLRILGLWCILSSGIRFGRVATGTETSEGADEPLQIGVFAVIALVGVLSSIATQIHWEEQQEQWIFGQLTTVAIIIIVTCFGFLFTDILERSDQPNPDVMVAAGAMAFAAPFICLLCARSSWLEACICGLVLAGPAVILQVITSSWLIMGYGCNCMTLYHFQHTLGNCFNSASKKHGQLTEAAFKAGFLAGLARHQRMLDEGSSANSAGSGTGNGKRPLPEAHVDYIVADNLNIPSEEDCDAAVDYMERFYATYAPPGCHDQLSGPPRLRQRLCDKESAMFLNNLLNQNLEFQTKHPLPEKRLPQQKMETSETSALQSNWGKVRTSTKARLPPSQELNPVSCKLQNEPSQIDNMEQRAADRSPWLDFLTDVKAKARLPSQELNPVSCKLQNEPSQIDNMEHFTTDVSSGNSSACKTQSSSAATLSDDSQQWATDRSPWLDVLTDLKASRTAQELSPVSCQLQNEPSQIDDMEHFTTDVSSGNSSACNSAATLSDDSQQEAADISILSDTRHVQHRQQQQVVPVQVWREEQPPYDDDFDVLAELLEMMDEDLDTQLADH